MILFAGELFQHYNLLFSTDNPIYYAILFTIIIFILLILLFKYVIIPLRQKYKSELHSLEFKNIKLMALFAELDPDPVIRIDLHGNIIFSNDSAKQQIIGGDSKQSVHISQIINSINFSISDYIMQDKSCKLLYNINSTSYSVLFRGLSSLSIAQLYFHNITDKEEYESKLRSLSNNLQSSIEEERQRIARELHDAVGQNLLLLQMDFTQNYKCFFEKPDFNLQYQNTLLLLQNTIFDLKNILYDLKPSILEEMGLGAAITIMINKISDESNIKGNLKIIGMEKRLKKNLEITIYRIIQESISNIIKHSKASSFIIRLSYFEEKIKILITDNGIGLSNYNNYNGFGLLNIQERVKSFNGNFKIGNLPDQGTFLNIDMPLILQR